MEKTRDEMIQDMYRQLEQTRKPEYMNEVAMPGVYQPVNPENMRKDK